MPSGRAVPAAITTRFTGPVLMIASLPDHGASVQSFKLLRRDGYGLLSGKVVSISGAALAWLKGGARERRGKAPSLRGADRFLCR